MGLGGEVQVSQVIFGERNVEITYMEPRDQSGDGRVLQVRSIAIDNTVVEEHLADLLDTLSEMVDAALLLVRNPEQARPARRKP